MTFFQVVSWVTPSFEQTEDDIRAEDCTQPHRIGLEDHIPGQNRDWNEELQTTRELPRETVTEKIIRERAIFKIHSDFVFAAIKVFFLSVCRVRFFFFHSRRVIFLHKKFESSLVEFINIQKKKFQGAIAVIDGNVIPLNPSEEPRTRMYIWNNIFFSLGFDVKDYYKVPFYKEFFNCRILFVLFLNFKKKVYRNRVAMPQLMQLLLMICKVFMLMHNLIIPNYLPLAW